MNLYTKRYEKLRELNEKTAQSFKDMTEKLKEFTAEYGKIKDKEPATEGIVEKSIINDNHLKAKKQFNAINGRYGSKIRTFDIKIKKLEEELANSKENELKINQEIEKNKEKYRELQFSLNDLQLKASIQNNKKLNNQASFSDDMMFITKKR